MAAAERARAYLVIYTANIAFWAALLMGLVPLPGI